MIGNRHEDESIFGQSIKNKSIKKDSVMLHKYNLVKYTPLREADMTMFTGRKIKLIDNEIRKLSSMNARHIEDYSHEDVPWIISEDREIIDYEAVFYRKEMHSVRGD